MFPWREIEVCLLLIKKQKDFKGCLTQSQPDSISSPQIPLLILAGHKNDLFPLSFLVLFNGPVGSF